MTEKLWLMVFVIKLSGFMFVPGTVVPQRAALILDERRVDMNTFWIFPRESLGYNTVPVP